MWRSGDTYLLPLNDRPRSGLEAPARHRVRLSLTDLPGVLPEVEPPGGKGCEVGAVGSHEGHDLVACHPGPPGASGPDLIPMLFPYCRGGPGRSVCRVCTSYQSCRARRAVVSK